MNIIYILTSLALIISYLLLNKSEKKENLIHSVIISVILFLTYNILITQVMFFVHLKSTLLGSSETFEVDKGKRGVGTTGYVYFADFDRTRPRTRKCKIIVLGE